MKISQLHFSNSCWRLPDLALEGNLRARGLILLIADYTLTPIEN